MALVVNGGSVAKGLWCIYMALHITLRCPTPIKGLGCTVICVKCGGGNARTPQLLCVPHAHKGARMLCLSWVRGWVGGWVGHLSVCGYANILGGWVPELTPPPPQGWVHSQQPPGVVQNWSTLQCGKQDTEQCGYDHAPVTRGRMRAQFPLPHGPRVGKRNPGLDQPHSTRMHCEIVDNHGEPLLMSNQELNSVMVQINWTHFCSQRRAPLCVP